MNIIFIFVFTFSSFSFASPQDCHKVAVVGFEFDPPSLDPNDMKLMERIKEKIKTELLKTQKVDEVSLFSTLDLAMLNRTEKKIEELCRSEGIRYIVEGKMENLPEDKIRMKVVLKDLDIDRDNKEIWNSKERTLDKDLKITDYWFDKLSGYICSVIKGVTIKEIVFVYCFRIFGEEDGKEHEIKLIMPKELHTRLLDKDFNEKYKKHLLKTFKTKLKRTEVCDKGKKRLDLDFYEYFIEGEIEPLENTGEYEITVELVIKDKVDSEVLVEGFKLYYARDDLDFLNKLSELAERIITELSNKIDK